MNTTLTKSAQKVQDLLKFDSVWAASGTPNAVFNLETKDLLAMTGGIVLSIK